MFCDCKQESDYSLKVSRVEDVATAISHRYHPKNHCEHRSGCSGSLNQFVIQFQDVFCLAEHPLNGIKIWGLWREVAYLSSSLSLNKICYFIYMVDTSVIHYHDRTRIDSIEWHENREE